MTRKTCGGRWRKFESAKYVMGRSNLAISSSETYICPRFSSSHMLHGASKIRAFSTFPIWLAIFISSLYSKTRGQETKCTELRERTGPRLRDPASCRVGEFTQPRALYSAALCTLVTQVASSAYFLPSFLAFFLPAFDGKSRVAAAAA